MEKYVERELELVCFKMNVPMNAIDQCKEGMLYNIGRNLHEEIKDLLQEDGRFIFNVKIEKVDFKWFDDYVLILVLLSHDSEKTYGK